MQTELFEKELFFALKQYLCWNELFEIELFWHWNCVLILKGTVWNRTAYMYKNGFGIGWPTMVDTP